MMKKNILLLLFMLLFVACETGTKYDRNETIDTRLSKEPKSGLVDRNIDALVEEDNIVERREAFDDDLHPIHFANDGFEERTQEDEISTDTFGGGEVTDGLDVKKIRVGRHDDYVRLVFDIYDENEAAQTVGNYEAKYNRANNDIAVVLNGYRKFSAALPSFSASSPIEKIYFERYEDDSAYKFHIQLKGDSKVRIFALESPARLVFDIKPI